MSEQKAIKYDREKPQLDLIPNDALVEIAKVLGEGAKKYSKANWAQGLHYSRLLSATLRHINTFNSGEDLDPETGLNHLAHAGCCIMFLLWMYKHRSDMDDRWEKVIAKK